MTNRYRKMMIISLILIVITGCSTGENYKNQLVGFVSEDNGYALVAYDPIDNSFTKIKSYFQMQYQEDCTITNQGDKVAYTAWNADGTNRYLVVEESHKVEEYYKTDNSVLTINNPIFLPNKDILFKKIEELDGFLYESLCLFNPKTKDELVIAEGINIRTVEIDENDNEIYHINQVELDSLLDYYGGDPVSKTETGSRLFVKYSKPILSSDGKTVFYVESLYRNAAKQGTGLVIASSIWSYDIKSQKSKKIYSAENRRLIGRITINETNDILVFVECFLITGEESQIIKFDLKEEKKEILVDVTKKEYVNLDPVFISNNHFTYLTISQGEPEESALRYDFNIDNRTRERREVFYNDRKELLRNFILVY